MAKNPNISRDEPDRAGDDWAADPNHARRPPAHCRHGASRKQSSPCPLARHTGKTLLVEVEGAEGPGTARRTPQRSFPSEATRTMKWSWRAGAFAGIGLHVHATFFLLIGVADQPGFLPRFSGASSPGESGQTNRPGKLDSGRATAKRNIRPGARARTIAMERQNADR